MTTDTPTSTRTPGRRHALLWGAGAVAAAAGAGYAWWRSPARALQTVTEPLPGFWDLAWDAPQGGQVQMRDFRGHPTLLNFWATWCPPCVEELPLLNDFYQTHRAQGWQVLGLAVDKLAAVQSFLQAMPLHFPVGMAGVSGAELGRSLGNLGGGLPFSVLLDPQGAIVQRKLGRLHAADLTAWFQGF